MAATPLADTRGLGAAAVRSSSSAAAVLLPPGARPAGIPSVPGNGPQSGPARAEFRLPAQYGTTRSWDTRTALAASPQHPIGLLRIAAGAAAAGASRLLRTRLRFSKEKVAKQLDPVQAPQARAPRAAVAPPSGEQGSPLVNATTGPLVLLFLAVLYGGNVPLLKSIEELSPLDLTAPELLVLRFMCASLTVLPWAVANFDKLLAVLRPAAELATWLWIGYTLQLFGLEKTSALTCSVATASTSVMVQALELAFDRKPISPLIAFFSLGTIGGIALFVSAPGGGGVADTLKPLVERLLNVFPMLAATPKLPHEAVLANVPGEVLTLGGAFFFGLHVWRCNRIVSEGDRTGKVTGTDFELALAAAQSLFATVLCALFSSWDSPYALSEQLGVAERLSGAIWLKILACGALCTGAPSIIELFAFKVVDPALSSLIYCTIPLWGTSLGVIFLKESLGLQGLVGGLIILVCSLAPSVIQILSKSPEEKKTVPLRSAVEKAQEQLSTREPAKEAKRAKKQ